MVEQADTKDIDVTKEDWDVLGRCVMDKSGGKFSDTQDVARVAVALAIQAGAKPKTRNKGERKAPTWWSKSGFDPDGHIRDVVELLYPDVTMPYRYIAQLIHEGVPLLETHLDRDGSFNLEKILTSMTKPLTGKNT